MNYYHTGEDGMNFTSEGCVLWGDRVIIPIAERLVIIAELHTGHPGMTKMKAVARSYLWWPGMDNDLEEAVRACERCQKHATPMVMAETTMVAHSRRLCGTVHGENVPCHC